MGGVFQGLFHAVEGEIARLRATCARLAAIRSRRLRGVVPRALLLRSRARVARLQRVVASLQPHGRPPPQPTRTRSPSSIAAAACGLPDAGATRIGLCPGEYPPACSPRAGCTSCGRAAAAVAGGIDTVHGGGGGCGGGGDGSGGGGMGGGCAGGDYGGGGGCGGEGLGGWAVREVPGQASRCCEPTPPQDGRQAACQVRGAVGLSSFKEGSCNGSENESLYMSESSSHRRETCRGYTWSSGMGGSGDSGGDGTAILDRDSESPDGGSRHNVGAACGLDYHGVSAAANAPTTTTAATTTTAFAARGEVDLVQEPVPLTDLLSTETEEVEATVPEDQKDEEALAEPRAGGEAEVDGLCLSEVGQLVEAAVLDARLAAASAELAAIRRLIAIVPPAAVRGLESLRAVR